MERNFIMKQYIALLILLLVPVLCYANDEKAGRFMNISSNVPKSMMIGEIQSWGLNHPKALRDPNDPNQAIRKREIDYTMIWLWKTINRDILKEVNQEDFQLLSGLGSKKDDALMISWNIDQFDITIVDGRFLALIVRVTNEDKADVEEVFKKIVRYWGNADRYRVEVNMETLSAADSNESWGQFTVSQNDVVSRYKKPVEWYNIGNEVIFAIEKFFEPPVSKVPLKDEIIFNYIGGIPIDDVRSYLRFENSNREDLAKEYYQKRKNEDDELHKEESKGLGGLPYGRRPYISEEN